MFSLHFCRGAAPHVGQGTLRLSFSSWLRSMAPYHATEAELNLFNFEHLDKALCLSRFAHHSGWHWESGTNAEYRRIPEIVHGASIEKHPA